MPDPGFFLTWQGVHRQLAAMPLELYRIRLIRHATRGTFPGERWWTAAQLSSAATLRFPRLRNREGGEVYFHPYSGHRNAGYILLDLDAARPAVVEALRRDGLEPCVVVQTSPGRWQAWLHLSPCPLEPPLATAIAQRLAHTYGADVASAHWRHLGRLAGFTNQKPERRTPGGYPPWVALAHARPGLAPRAEPWLQSATTGSRPGPGAPAPVHRHPLLDSGPAVAPTPISPPEAIQIYHDWLRRWRAAERFPQPDRSIADLWVARELLSRGLFPAELRTILQLGRPRFPRRHGHPQDCLRRTLARAAFSRPGPARPACATLATIPPWGDTPLPEASATGGF